MPFGFDPIETERKVNEVKNIKVYLDIVVNWLTTGQMLPISFIWTDGREFKIDKIIAIQKGE